MTFYLYRVDNDQRPQHVMLLAEALLKCNRHEVGSDPHSRQADGLVLASDRQP